MKLILTGLVLAATSAAALSASAQVKGKLDQIQIPTERPPLNMTPDILDTKKPGQANLLGCVASEVYNTQSVTAYSVLVVLETSEGDRRVNFEGDKIRYVPPGDPLPLATTAQTLKWTRILDTIERAAAADKPLVVSYSTPSNDVFGVMVQWSGDCP
ncbi:hypothetical protein WNY37_03735 [Henriciella sp. AS95]|uniref:hypothetical protein n=1 Tax=Henriciella sp. AS95 TaxID=3135782 RepID=UPI00316B674C